MAKARSKRTMRNRKSRNRRGGGGVESKKFKEINALNDNDKLCDFVEQMIKVGKKDIILSELDDGEKEKFNECEKEKNNDFENDTMNPRIRQQPQGGGKSRRRHRRGRTLHKRRKSRKVRKTRCRRK